MPQFNLSKKLVSSVQLWASLLLIVLAFVFSMTPIITLETSLDVLESEAFEDVDLEELFEELELDADFLEDYEELELSAPKLIGSFKLIAQIIAVSAADEEDQEDMYEDLRDYLESEEGEEAVATAICLVIAIVNTVDFDTAQDAVENENVEDAASSMSVVIFGAVISIFSLFAVIFITLFLPVIFGFMVLFSLIKALSNITTPENAAPALAKKLPAKIALPLTLMLFQCVVPGMTYAKGLTAICAITIIATVLNFIASRVRTYESDHFTYLNITQGCSVISIIGFFVFFFNMLKTGILKAFISGEFFTAIVKYTMASETTDADVDPAFLICGILMIIYIAVMFKSRKYLKSVAGRFSCAAKRERAGFVRVFADSHIVRAIFCLIVYIIPTYILGQEYCYDDIIENGDKTDFCFLDLKNSQEDALTAALVGIILMIAAEIAIIVLKRVFCSKMSTEEREAVLTGKAPTVETDSFVYFAKPRKAKNVEEAVSDEVASEDESVTENGDDTPTVI